MKRKGGSCEMIGYQTKGLSMDITGYNGMLKITIDPRLELLAIIQYLSGSKMVGNSGVYATAIEAWFSEYKNYPVIQILKNMESRGYSHDLPVSSFLLFEDYTCNKQSFFWDPTSEEMNLKRLDYIAEKTALDDFYKLVGQFAINSDFTGFFASQKEFYRKRVRDAEDVLKNNPDMIAHMIGYYGYSHESYTLAISPLVIGGYGPALIDQEGGTHTFCVVDLDFSKISEREFKQVSSWFFHEFSHSFINPLVEEHWDILKEGEQVFEQIADKMEKQNYGSWWITVAEHFVRVSVIRLSELYYHIDSSKLLEGEKGRGFIFISSTYEGILKYEVAHKQEGVDYASFFPTMAQYFIDRTAISQDGLDNFLKFQGPMNSVFVEDDVLIIYPDPIRVEGVQEYIIPSVEWLKNKGYEVVTDKTAQEMDLSQRNLCIYGSWGSNLILKKFSKEMPFDIHPDKIIADKSYKGNKLRIALCLPNPLNSKKGMCVYTAQTTVAMKNAAAIFHGPEDWYVSNSELEVLASGYFKDKNKDIDWSF